MRVCAVLVKGPDADISPSNGYISDGGDSHVRMGFQAKGEDRDADEED